MPGLYIRCGIRVQVLMKWNGVQSIYQRDISGASHEVGHPVPAGNGTSRI
ncbi:hypothetical protein SAMN04489729_0801 [Amycolatopsis lurida]|nr:hypothetical protein [Amycolatopsis lurida]SEB38682.1 hypothetical protein SAMN04489729_0801 [Amycolatopsis lurida]